MNTIDMDKELDGHTERDADAELGVDAATATALRDRLTALAGAAQVPADGWDRLTARTGGTAGGRRGTARWRRRLVAAAAVLLVLVGSTVTHGPDDGRTDVETDDTPSTTVDRDVDDRERATADDDRTSEDDGARGTSDATPGASDVPAPGPADAGAGESAGSAPAGGLGGPGSGSTAGSGGGGSTSAPRAPATTTTSPATTTTAPPPPPRLPGDITVTTSSGFAVELVLDAAPSRISAVVRRTDSRYDGSQGTFTSVSDGYTFSSGVVIAGENPTLGGRCLRAGAVDSQGFTPHHFTVGLTGSEIAGVRLRMADGTVVTALMTQRSVANGVRAYLAEVPTRDVVGVDGVDAAGELVVSTAPPNNYGCG